MSSTFSRGKLASVFANATNGPTCRCSSPNGLLEHTQVEKWMGGIGPHAMESRNDERDVGRGLVLRYYEVRRHSSNTAARERITPFLTDANILFS